MMDDMSNAREALNQLSGEVYSRCVKAGWWTDIQTGKPLGVDDRTHQCIALIHSEVSEAYEAFRKDQPDGHLPERHGLEVELADAVIRILDLAGAHGFYIGDAIVEKLAYNATRADHKLEARQQPGGKKF